MASEMAFLVQAPQNKLATLSFELRVPLCYYNALPNCQNNFAPQKPEGKKYLFPGKSEPGCRLPFRSNIKSSINARAAEGVYIARAAAAALTLINILRSKNIFVLPDGG